MHRKIIRSKQYFLSTLQEVLIHKQSLCTTRSSEASKHQNQGGICIEQSHAAGKIFLVLHMRFSDKKSLCTTICSKASKQAASIKIKGVYACSLITMRKQVFLSTSQKVFSQPISLYNTKF